MASRSWCFTINNYTEADITAIEGLLDLSNVLYAAKEQGDNGTPHIQGYITWAKTRRLAALKKFLPRAHWERAKGRKKDNYNYIIEVDSTKHPTKTQGEVLFNHDNTNQGKRSDLELAIDTLQERGVAAVAEDHPVEFVKYSKGLTALWTASFSHREHRNPPTVYWLYGASGTGKTRSVFDAFETSEVYMWNRTDKWFDGYQQQRVLLFDELRPNNCHFSNLLGFLDRYPINLPIKGGFIPLNSPILVITSCYSPRDCYQMLQDGDSIDQLLRRITKTIEFPDGETQTLLNPFAPTEVSPAIPSPLLARSTAQDYAWWPAEQQDSEDEVLGDILCEPRTSVEPVRPRLAVQFNKRSKLHGGRSSTFNA